MMMGWQVGDSLINEDIVQFDNIIELYDVI